MYTPPPKYGPSFSFDEEVRRNNEWNKQRRGYRPNPNRGEPSPPPGGSSAPPPGAEAPPPGAEAGPKKKPGMWERFKAGAGNARAKAGAPIRGLQNFNQHPWGPLGKLAGKVGVPGAVLVGGVQTMRQSPEQRAQTLRRFGTRPIVDAVLDGKKGASERTMRMNPETGKIEEVGPSVNVTPGAEFVADIADAGRTWGLNALNAFGFGAPGKVADWLRDDPAIMYDLRAGQSGSGGGRGGSTPGPGNITDTRPPTGVTGRYEVKREGDGAAATAQMQKDILAGNYTPRLSNEFTTRRSEENQKAIDANVATLDRQYQALRDLRSAYARPGADSGIPGSTGSGITFEMLSPEDQQKVINAPNGATAFGLTNIPRLTAMRDLRRANEMNAAARAVGGRRGAGAGAGAIAAGEPLVPRTFSDFMSMLNYQRNLASDRRAEANSDRAASVEGVRLQGEALDAMNDPAKAQAAQAELARSSPDSLKGRINREMWNKNFYNTLRDNESWWNPFAKTAVDPAGKPLGPNDFSYGYDWAFAPFNNWQEPIIRQNRSGASAPYYNANPLLRELMRNIQVPPLGYPTN